MIVLDSGRLLNWGASLASFLTSFLSVLAYGASNPLLACRSLLNSSTTLQQRTAIIATLQSVRLAQGRPQNGTSLRLEVNCSRIRMLGRANTARSTSASGWEWGPVAMTPPTNLGELLLVHVEEHGANGRRDYVQSCRSHTGYMSQDMCRGSFLSESSSTDSSDERAWFADYAGVKVEGLFKGEHQLH